MVREFSTILPDKECIEQMIRAGLTAPFVSFPAAGKTDFRKFFILPSVSPMMKKVESIMNDRMGGALTTSGRQHWKRK